MPLPKRSLFMPRRALILASCAALLSACTMTPSPGMRRPLSPMLSPSIHEDIRPETTAYFRRASRAPSRSRRATAPSFDNTPPPAPQRPAHPPTLATRAIAKPVAPVSPRAPSAQPADRPFEASAFAYDAIAALGLTLDPHARTSPHALYYACKKARSIHFGRRAERGDLIFFHNTVDQNEDGRHNDWYTHVAVVESIDERETITVLTQRDGELARASLNLNHPDQGATPEGHTLNHELRARAEGDLPYTQYLGSQLFAGFCDSHPSS